MSQVRFARHDGCQSHPKGWRKGPVTACQSGINIWREEIRLCGSPAHDPPLLNAPAVLAEEMQLIRIETEGYVLALRRCGGCAKIARRHHRAVG